MAVLSGAGPRAAARDRRRRREALPGGPRHRQAHRGADHRRAAREGGGEIEGDADAAALAPGEEDARSLAREGLLNLGYTPPEAEKLLSARRGREPEEIVAVGAAQRGGGEGRMSVEPGKGIRTPGHRRDEEIVIHDARPAGRGRRLRPLASPAEARGLRQPGPGHRAARHLHRGGAAARRGARPRAAGRTPGLGKTSLAHIIAAELEVPMVQTAGPALERKADIAAFLTSLEPGSVFFIDEIHRLGRAVEETLYPAMEDRQLPVVARPGRGRAHRDPRPAAVHADRRDHAHRPADDAAARPLRRLAPARALRRGRPRPDRPALRRDPRHRGRRGRGGGDRGAAPAARPASPTGCCAGCGTSPRSRAGARRSPSSPRTRSRCSRSTAPGLDRHDRQLLELMASKFAGGPVGLSTLAVAIGEEADTIEDVFEPYLLQQGLVKRTPRGRVLTERAYEHLGLAGPGGHGQPVLGRRFSAPVGRLALASLRAGMPYFICPELREQGTERGAHRRLLHPPEGLLQVRLRLPLRVARRLHARTRAPPSSPATSRRGSSTSARAPSSSPG